MSFEVSGFISQESREIASNLLAMYLHDIGCSDVRIEVDGLISPRGK
jgi:hypothetical protein